MEKKDKQDFSFDLPKEIGDGTYSNMVIISHSPSEFVFDFAQTMPGSPNPVIRQRVIMAPMHAKRFLMAMQDNIRKYEKTYGNIVEPGMPEPAGDTVPYDIIGKA